MTNKNSSESTLGKNQDASNSLSHALKEQRKNIPEDLHWELPRSSPNPLKQKRSSPRNLGQGLPPQSVKAFDQSNRPKTTARHLPGNPSTPTSPSCSQSILPLTADNLRKLHKETRTMADFNTPKSRRTDSTSKPSKDVKGVRQILSVPWHAYWR